MEKIFEFCISEMARNALKLFTMVGEKFEICISKMAGNALILSTMLGENHADIGGSIITERKSFRYVPLILLSRCVLESSYRIGVGLVESKAYPV